LNEMGQSQSALDTWKKAVALQPDLGVSLGERLQSEGKPEDAIALYQHAIAVQPNQVEFYLKLGNIFREQKQLDAAIKSYQQALEIDPKLVEAHLQLGEVLGRKGEYEEAVSCCQRALEVDHNSAAAYTCLAKVFILYGNRNEALSCLYKSNQIKSVNLIDSGKVPGILLNTLAKSGSFYILEAIYKGLNINWMPISAESEVIKRADIGILASGMNATQEHLHPSSRNLCLISEVLDKLVVHVRDPRQATISWVHHLIKTTREIKDVRSLLPAIPTAENYFSWSLTEQISWQIESGYLPIAISFIEGWLNAEADPSFYPEILFTKYEDLAAEPQAFFESILKFYKIEKFPFTFPEPPQQGKLHYRKGKADEWREVFTPEQAEKASSMIPQRLFDRFGWPQR
ncbi:tetratricopeptide repeat protein, partial [Microcoleus sp. ARI1-A4]